MAYEIVWNSKAEDDLSDLDNEAQKRIILKLDSIVENPHRFLDYLQKYCVYKLRVGEWRIFIDIHDNCRELEVLRIRHRSKAYQRL